MKIRSLSPSPHWGGPTFREGWGEGWFFRSTHNQSERITNPGKSGSFFGEQIRTRFCRFNSPLIKLT